MEIPTENTMENGGKQNPKMGFKSPPEQRSPLNSSRTLADAGMRNFAISLLFECESLCSRKRAALVQTGYLENTAKNFVRRLTTILFPLDSVVFYPNGKSPGNSMANSGKQNPKMGFKSPRI
jgi:hypothetical protein